MIFLLPINNIIKYFAFFYALTCAFLFYISLTPHTDPNLLSYIKIVLGGSTALSFLIYAFFSFGWRYIWKLIPWLNTAVFPDLNGQWDMTIEWNNRERNGVAQARATVRQDFLRISMEVHSRDSDSETLLAQPKRNLESGWPALFYSYRVIPKMKAGRADLPYEGSAILKLSPDKDVGLQGNYFTSVGTTGHFRLNRPAAN